MNEEQLSHPDYIFEVSWEVCNKVGGIHTVISTKALSLVNELEDRLIMIGPDVWKGADDNPEFKEDLELFKSWRPVAESQGLKLKIGRWKIAGNPIVVLIDFTGSFSKKDAVFSDLWINYKVDSISGQWDYIEPALFGYVSGKVIECFYHHYITFSDKIIAQFHEWMTGAGLLYLESHVPQIASVFTTHATAAGRAIAGNGLPLYSKFDSYDGDREAKEFNIVSKHSIEKKSAQYADCFTTVSEITAKECKKLLEKQPDIITPNGFEDSFVPDPFLFKDKRVQARRKLIQVAETVFGKEISNDATLVLKSGRYEFRNKGIDIFIDALGVLNKTKNLQKEIVAFIFVPAHQTGPRKIIQELPLKRKTISDGTDRVLTHHLQGVETDPVMNAIKKNNLGNGEENQVNVIFSPTYLDGTDGIYNMTYYDLLIGFDISSFPSYYEPWGYTPLESLAFHVPTITTNLAGFGILMKNSSPGIYVLSRTDNNNNEIVEKIASILKEFSEKAEKDVKEARNDAYQLSRQALWKNLIIYYKKAYHIALQKTKKRENKFVIEPKTKDHELPELDNKISLSDKPVWYKLFVQTSLPENLTPLKNLAMNLWWTWNEEAEDLFKMIDTELWIKSNFNPVSMIDNLSYTQLSQLQNDNNFLDKLIEVNNKFEAYMNVSVEPNKPLVAYFCMEYGIHSSLKLYSGGLGVLAGDFLKEASNLNTNLVAVGLLYRNGYFKQIFTLHGDQLAQEDTQKFTELPLAPVRNNEGEWLKVTIPFPARTLYAKAYTLEVGRTTLYLLDADISENAKEDRDITTQLYGGGQENRLKQEILLGIGGVRLLNMLGYKPNVYHCNEGHAAFTGIERIYRLILEENISFEEAFEIVKGSALFTTHTPVEAGHDKFEEDLLRAYFSHYPHVFNIKWRELMALGMENPENLKEEFSMSFLAAKLSSEINGVSELHHHVTKKMFNNLWKGYTPDELKIGYVTNGIHIKTWLARPWKELFTKELGQDFYSKINTSEKWNEIESIADEKIWDTHLQSKRELIKLLKENIITNLAIRQANPTKINKFHDLLNDNTLIIGFARRFVPYKRAGMLFQNLEKLSNMVNDKNKQVVFIFSGKAHPKDYAGQQMIKNIILFSERPEFEGKIMFLENYNMNIAKYLVSGVDLWLNTPVYGMEASGTSGMKAAINGVLNFSVLDGWWIEGFNKNNGWSIEQSEIKADNFRDEMDAEHIYNILNTDIIPTFFTRNEQGIPELWVKKMKNSIATITPVYNTNRMFNEYNNNYYAKLNKRHQELTDNHFKNAHLITLWKEKIKDAWNGIKIVSLNVFDSSNKAFPLGENLKAKVILDLNGLLPEEIGVEIVFIHTRLSTEEMEQVFFSKELTLSEEMLKTDQYIYSSNFPINFTGVHEYGFRVFPKNPLIPSRLDFPLIRWL